MAAVEGVPKYHKILNSFVILWDSLEVDFNEILHAFPDLMFGNKYLVDYNMDIFTIFKKNA